MDQEFAKMDQETNQQAAKCRDAAKADALFELRCNLSDDALFELRCNLSDGQLNVCYVHPEKKISLSILLQTNTNDEEPMDTAEDCNGESQEMEEAMEID